jgi:uncharacterized protein DUF6644
MIAEIAARLEQLPLPREIAESPWGFPILEIVHVMAISLVVGSIAMIDLRLLGVGAQNRPITKLIGQLLPWTWVAFTVALLAGSLLFSSKATEYLHNVFFQAKLICLALAGTNMLTFHLVTARGIARWDLGRPPGPARAAGLLSLCLWISTVALGRWMGFV